MTEKRFTVPLNYRCIQDNLTKERYMCEDKPEAIDLAYLLNSLNDENEQLKQRNDKQCTQLKQLWELIEDEDYNTLRSMLNQRETDEKLLQKEWRTYSD